jgi:hypothetical protein
MLSGWRTQFTSIWLQTVLISLFSIGVAWSQDNNETQRQGEFITRQFYVTNGVVWIKDNICLSTNNDASLMPEVRKVIQAGNVGKTNVVSLLNTLLDGEPLQLCEWKSEMGGGYVKVEMISRLHGERSKFLPVHLVATYARYSRSVKIDGKLVPEPYALIRADSEGAVMWMPEWEGTASLARDLATIHTLQSIRNFNRHTKSEGLLIKSVIMQRGEQTVIFEDHPDRPARGIPSERFIKSLESFRPISGNDWNNLFTDFKPAKPGFYLLDASAFTNIPPTNLQR